MANNALDLTTIAESLPTAQKIVLYDLLQSVRDTHNTVVPAYDLMNKLKRYSFYKYEGDRIPATLEADLEHLSKQGFLIYEKQRLTVDRIHWIVEPTERGMELADYLSKKARTILEENL